MSADRGKAKRIAKMRSISAIGRPLMKAIAPPSLCFSAASAWRKLAGTDHFERRRCEVEQRAVDIEKNRGSIQVQRVGGQRYARAAAHRAGFSGRCLRRTGLNLGVRGSRA